MVEHRQAPICIVLGSNHLSTVMFAAAAAAITVAIVDDDPLFPPFLSFFFKLNDLTKLDRPIIAITLTFQVKVCCQTGWQADRHSPGQGANHSPASLCLSVRLEIYVLCMYVCVRNMGGEYV